MAVNFFKVFNLEGGIQASTCFVSLSDVGGHA